MTLPTPFATIVERLTGPGNPTAGYRSAPLPTRIDGHAVYVVFHANVRRSPGGPLPVSAPNRWWIFDERGHRALTATESALGLVPGLPEVGAFVVDRPAGPAEGQKARDDLLELIGMAAPEFFRGARPANGLASYAQGLVAVGLGSEELRAWRQAAPDFLAWLLDA